MNRERHNAGGARVRLAAALAFGAFALTVSGATHAKPEDHHHDKSGSGGVCSSCGGGGSGSSTTRQEASGNAGDRAKALVNPEGSGGSGGGGGGGGEALGGPIAQLGEDEESQRKDHEAKMEALERQLEEIRKKRAEAGLPSGNPKLDSPKLDDTTTSAIADALAEVEAEDALAKKREEEARLAKAEQQKRQTQEEMMDLLNLATKKGQGKSNLTIMVETAAEKASKLIPPGGNAAQGGKPPASSTSSPGAGAPPSPGKAPATAIAKPPPRPLPPADTFMSAAPEPTPLPPEPKPEQPAVGPPPPAAAPPEDQFEKAIKNAEQNQEDQRRPH